ncbi:transposase [Aeromicrobium sp. YIM 150415]|uniref:transposase n=1 Tax=Aeromicrobium sp. YIM 150415 TaxID=2803912 RepID=UPI0035ABFB85
MRPLPLPQDAPRRGGPRTHSRKVIDAIRYRERTGTNCRELPVTFGSWHTSSPSHGSPIDQFASNAPHNIIGPKLLHRVQPACALAATPNADTQTRDRDRDQDQDQSKCQTGT